MGYSQAVRQQILTLSFRGFKSYYPSQANKAESQTTFLFFVYINLNLTLKRRFLNIVSSNTSCLYEKYKFIYVYSIKMIIFVIYFD